MHIATPHSQVEKPQDILKAERLVFPGVGSFGQAMTILKQKGMIEPLKEYLMVRVLPAATERPHASHTEARASNVASHGIFRPHVMHLTDSQNILLEVLPPCTEGRRSLTYTRMLCDHSGVLCTRSHAVWSPLPWHLPRPAAAL